RRRSGPVNTSITSCLVLVKNTVLCLPVSLSGRPCPEIQGAAPLRRMLGSLQAQTKTASINGVVDVSFVNPLIFGKEKK
ncbi:hypothetical protein, partial [Burkholderia thailandensis]|uniref:hypothetical protein n=1 Tax=Burkholderia thailandensis TaxID=57975 RepID=UPI002362AB22